MSEVKRYDIVGDMDGNCNLNEARMELSDDGVYVKHRDYEALQAKCAALAAEVEAVKSAHQDAVNTIMYTANRTGVLYTEKAIQISCKTPGTDAFLAEIERKAILKFIKSIEHILRDKLSPYDTEEMLEDMRTFLEEQGGKQ